MRHDDDDLFLVHAPELHPPAIPGRYLQSTKPWNSESRPFGFLWNLESTSLESGILACVAAA